MRNVTVMFAVALMIFVGVVISDGAIVVDHPEDIMAPNDGTFIFLEMDVGARLMEEVGGVSTTVTLDGDDQCFVIFGEKIADANLPGGYLIIESDGWGSGVVYEDILPEGSSSDFVVVLLDDDGGGFGETEGGIFTPYSNVEVWETGLGFIGAGGIVYNDVLGGVTDFVFTPENAWSPIIMDDIVLVVPEPATVMLLLGIGLPILLRRRREK